MEVDREQLQQLQRQVQQLHLDSVVLRGCGACVMELFGPSDELNQLDSSEEWQLRTHLCQTVVASILISSGPAFSNVTPRTL